MAIYDNKKKKINLLAPISILKYSYLTKMKITWSSLELILKPFDFLVSLKPLKTGKNKIWLKCSLLFIQFSCKCYSLKIIATGELLIVLCIIFLFSLLLYLSLALPWWNWYTIKSFFLFIISFHFVFIQLTFFAALFPIIGSQFNVNKMKKKK